VLGLGCLKAEWTQEISEWRYVKMFHLKTANMPLFIFIQILGYLRLLDVGNVADVSEVNIAFVFCVEVRRII
jgi:hypothetical protein